MIPYGEDSIIDSRRVAELTGRSAKAVGILLHRGRLPEPVGYLGQSPGWLESEIVEWALEPDNRPEPKRRGRGSPGFKGKGDPEGLQSSGDGFERRDLLARIATSHGEELDRLLEQLARLASGGVE